jgi:hypothetical protein
MTCRAPWLYNDIWLHAHLLLFQSCNAKSPTTSMSFPTHPHLLFRQHHTSTLLAQITICTHTDTVLRLQGSQCQNACALAGHTVCHCCNNDEHTQKLDFSHSLIMIMRERERERERREDYCCNLNFISYENTLDYNTLYSAYLYHKSLHLFN